MSGVCAWREMLVAVNQARASARMCGTRMMPAVPALRWSTRLETAARSHNEHMASASCFSHDTTGSDPCRDGTPCNRVVASGYRWSAYAENIAAGTPFSSVSAVMNGTTVGGRTFDGWLDSPGHCANIMNANVTELGADRFDRSGSEYGTYWTQVFGRPGANATCP
jgi:uncharacterized protein YkwD